MQSAATTDTGLGTRQPRMAATEQELVTLPLASGHETPVTGHETMVRPMKILAAEDNPVFQSMLRSMLTKWGYDVIMAQNGVEALEILHSADAPRLAILDWMMPGMDGVEVCSRVRAAGREPYTYILLLTARTESQDLVEGMESGADDYITKIGRAHV